MAYEDAHTDPLRARTIAGCHGNTRAAGADPPTKTGDAHAYRDAPGHADADSDSDPWRGLP